MCAFFRVSMYNEFMNRFRKKYISFAQRFLTLDDTPHRIAIGASVGLFMGILPIESISASLITTAIFSLNHAAALIGVAAMNIWATIVVLPLAAIVGGNLFGASSAELADQFYQTYQSGWGYFFTKAAFLNLAAPLLVGYIIVSTIISVAFYFFMYSILKCRKV